MPSAGWPATPVPFRRDHPGPRIGEEVDPLDQLHRDEPVASVRDQLIQAHQVGMGDVRQCSEFILEAIEFGRAGGPHRLQGHDPIPTAIVGPIDNSHPAMAQFPEDRVALDGRQDRSDVDVHLRGREDGRVLRVHLQGVNASLELLEQLGAVVTEVFGGGGIPQPMTLEPGADQPAQSRLDRPHRTRPLGREGPPPGDRPGPPRFQRVITSSRLRSSRTSRSARRAVAVAGPKNGPSLSALINTLAYRDGGGQGPFGTAAGPSILRRSWRESRSTAGWRGCRSSSRCSTAGTRRSPRFLAPMRGLAKPAEIDKLFCRRGFVIIPCETGSPAKWSFPGFEVRAAPLDLNPAGRSCWLTCWGCGRVASGNPGSR